MPRLVLQPAASQVASILERMRWPTFAPGCAMTAAAASALRAGVDSIEHGVGLTDEIQGMLMERLAEQAIVNGFTNVMFLNDHGGGVRVARDEDTLRRLSGRQRSFHCRVILGALDEPAEDGFHERVLAQGERRAAHCGTEPAGGTRLASSSIMWTRTVPGLSHSAGHE